MELNAWAESAVAASVYAAAGPTAAHAVYRPTVPRLATSALGGPRSLGYPSRTVLLADDHQPKVLANEGYVKVGVSSRVRFVGSMIMIFTRKRSG